jgi:hypothetical protein
LLNYVERRRSLSDIVCHDVTHAAFPDYEPEAVAGDTRGGESL